MTSPIEFPNVFKAYDVRAVYPEPLSESVAYRIGFGAGSFLKKSAQGKPVVVGRDMRPHSPALVRELQRGLLASGVRVIDVGLVDTPFLYWAVNELDGAGAIQTTASHNPIQYNGFKISGPGAAPIGRESGLQDIEALAAGCNYQPGDETPAVEHLDLWDGYRKHIHRFLPASLLDGTVRLKVAVDASNGMAGTMVPKVFSDLPGLELIELHFENDQGSFVHEPNPLVEANLRWTQEAVREHGCDFGVCFDGDAGRCVFNLSEPKHRGAASGRVYYCRVIIMRLTAQRSNVVCRGQHQGLRRQALFDARQKVFLPSQPFDLPKAQRQETRKHHHGSKKREGAPHAQNSCFNERPRPVRHPEYR